MAIPPSSTAGRSFSAPPNLPKGVRATPNTTVSATGCHLRICCAKSLSSARSGSVQKENASLLAYPLNILLTTGLFLAFIRGAGRREIPFARQTAPLPAGGGAFFSETRTGADGPLLSQDPIFYLRR